MHVTDPIADFFTRIRNASKAKLSKVDIPASKLKIKITEILKNENFISDFTIIEDNKQNVIRIQLKYTNGVPAISGLKRISKPGLRIYKPADELPRILNGLGLAIISTSKGLLTDNQARQHSLGGEVIGYIW